MKNVLMVVLTLLCLPTLAQTNCGLSNDFQKKWDTYYSLANSRPTSWSSGDSDVLNLDIKIAHAALDCLPAISNERDCMKLLADCTMELGWTYMMQNDNTMPESMKDNVILFEKLSNEFWYELGTSFYARKGSEFATDQIAEVHFPINRDGSMGTVVKLKHSLGTYDANQLFWIDYYTIDNFADTIEASPEERKYAASVLQSECPMFADIADDYLP